MKIAGNMEAIFLSAVALFLIADMALAAAPAASASTGASASASLPAAAQQSHAGKVQTVVVQAKRQA